jgi:hypothetical protein
MCLKKSFDAYPVYESSVDPLEYNSDNEKEEKVKQGKRRWLSR